MSRKTTVTLSLDTESDKDIIRWLDRQENRSAAIRAAIRDHIGGSGVTLGDIFQAVKKLENRIQAGAVVVAQTDASPDEWDEPPDVAAALDALADL